MIIKIKRRSKYCKPLHLVNFIYDDSWIWYMNHKINSIPRKLFIHDKSNSKNYINPVIPEYDTEITIIQLVKLNKDYKEYL